MGPLATALIAACWHRQRLPGEAGHLGALHLALEAQLLPPLILTQGDLPLDPLLANLQLILLEDHLVAVGKIHQFAVAEPVSEIRPLQLDAPLGRLLFGRAHHKQLAQLGGSLGEPLLTLLHAHFADELGGLALLVQPLGQLAVVIKGKLGGGLFDPEQLATLEVVAALPFQLAQLVHDGHGDDNGDAIDPGLDIDAVMAELTGIEGALGPLLHQGKLLGERSGQRREGAESQGQRDRCVAH